MTPVLTRVEALREERDSKIEEMRHQLRIRIRRLRRDYRQKIEAIQRGATNLSEEGVKFIADHEGFSPHPIKLAGEAHFTWGYGHYGPDVPATGTISREQALKLLEQDVALAEKAVSDNIDVTLAHRQFDMLVSWVFNCGVNAIVDSTLRRVLNAGHYDQVPEQLMRWVRDGTGGISEGLKNRRRDECRVWRHGYA